MWVREDWRIPYEHTHHDQCIQSLAVLDCFWVLWWLSESNLWVVALHWRLLDNNASPIISSAPGPTAQSASVLTRCAGTVHSPTHPILPRTWVGKNYFWVLKKNNKPYVFHFCHFFFSSGQNFVAVALFCHSSHNPSPHLFLFFAFFLGHKLWGSVHRFANAVDLLITLRKYIYNDHHSIFFYYLCCFCFFFRMGQKRPLKNLLPL